MMTIFMLSFLSLSLILLAGFYLLSINFKWNKLSSSIFECGFTSYYNSRNSFSIHYYLIALIFLFLDLEICLIMPFLNENWNNTNMLVCFNIFILVLMSGLIMEWKLKKFDWIY